MPAKGSTVIALVGVQLFDPSLSPNPQLIHGCFSADNVVAVAFKGHIHEWQSVLLGEQRDIGTVAVMLGVIPNTRILRSLDQRTIHIAEM